MTLYDTAKIFKDQLLDKFYIINTETNVLYIRTFPKNLVHLTGIQRTKELHKIKNLPKFYYDCLEKKYMKNILKYTYNNYKERDMVDMKVSNFDKIQDTILNASILYYTKDEYGKPSKSISVNYIIKNKSKYLTMIFKQDQETNFYVPSSIQLDQSLDYGVIPTAYKQESITSVQMLDYLSQATQDIIKSSR